MEKKKKVMMFLSSSSKSEWDDKVLKVGGEQFQSVGPQYGDFNRWCVLYMLNIDDQYHYV